jgi:hypothetical protein
MVLSTMDAFISAVEDARYQLSRKEGRDISVRQLLERAGYTGGKRAGAQYHLNRTKEWKGGHKVPHDLVVRLAEVLPISYQELRQAAQLAAGYTIEVTDARGADVPAAFARMLGDSEVSPAKKAETTARLLQIIAAETAKQALDDEQLTGN